MSELTQEQRANDAAFNLARECERQMKETGVTPVASMKVGQKFVVMAGASHRGGAWWLSVPVADAQVRAEVIAAFPELMEAA